MGIKPQHELEVKPGKMSEWAEYCIRLVENLRNVIESKLEKQEKECEVKIAKIQQDCMEQKELAVQNAAVIANLREKIIELTEKLDTDNAAQNAAVTNSQLDTNYKQTIKSNL